MTETTITQRQFFEQAREGRLTAVRCGHCGALAIPPREFCADCSHRTWAPAPLSGEGTIASYTIIRVAAARHAADAPYAVGVVKLKEGASIFARIVDVLCGRDADDRVAGERALPGQCDGLPRARTAGGA